MSSTISDEQFLAWPRALFTYRPPGALVFVDVLITTIGMLTVTSNLFGDIPYWPIEISRMAASGYLSYFLFCIIVIWRVSIIYKILGSYPRGVEFKHLCCIKIPLYGALILAIFDDESSMITHNIGLIILFIGIILFTIMYHRGNDHIFIIGAMSLLFFIRIISKGLVVSFYEMGDDCTDFHGFFYKILTFDVHFINNVKYRSLDIMMSGNFINLIWTPLIFKCAAVMQWVVIIGFTYVYCDIVIAWGYVYNLIAANL